MKKLLVVALVLLMSVPVFATVNQQITQAKAIEVLRIINEKMKADVASYTVIRQQIEDKLANEAANLEVGDRTKFTALPSEINDITTAMSDLLTKINTYYPEVNQ